jgi:hypothetical protein
VSEAIWALLVFPLAGLSTICGGRLMRPWLCAVESWLAGH